MASGDGCAQTGNAALYCVEQEKDDVRTDDVIMTSGPAPTETKPPAPPAGPTVGPDFSAFDIVKATQYGAFDRVRHLIQEEVSFENLTTPFEIVRTLRCQADR